MGRALADSGQPARPINELAPSGLLWLINATTFHPRGLALAFVTDDEGMIVGWRLVGDGAEPAQFNPGPDLDALFRAALETMGDAMVANANGGQ
jgi:hypothetical protein